MKSHIPRLLQGQHWLEHNADGHESNVYQVKKEAKTSHFSHVQIEARYHTVDIKSILSKSSNFVGFNLLYVAGSIGVMIPASTLHVPLFEP